MDPPSNEFNLIVPNGAKKKKFVSCPSAVSKSNAVCTFILFLFSNGAIVIIFSDEPKLPFMFL